jgi:hypothetical protein
VPPSASASARQEITSAGEGRRTEILIVASVVVGLVSRRP